MTGYRRALVREFVLNEVFVLDGDDPDAFVRAMAADVLGTDDLDMSFVVFTTDPEGVTLASGRVVTQG